MTLATVLLQAATGFGGGGAWSTILMFALLIVVFYFFLIRPQSKRQKEIRKFQDSLENGKSVITQGGIYGKIREVKDNYVILEIGRCKNKGEQKYGIRFVGSDLDRKHKIRP